jgi:uncharacterized membrane protein YecN with MAPEG domain
MPNLVLPAVSATTAGLLLLIQMGLMYAAARQRQVAKQPIGDIGDPTLLRAVRRHGNFAENAAIFIVCVALLEMLGGGRLWVEALCAGFLIGRIAHAIGLSMENTVNPFRIGGVIITVAVGIALGIRLVLIGVAHL